MSPITIFLVVAGLLVAAVALSPAGALGPPTPPSEETGAKLKRAEYFDERRMLIEARQRSYQAIEQMIAGGSSGALVLSITFLEKLAPERGAVGVVYLVLGWVVLVATLSLSLLGQYLSAKAFEREVDRLDASVHNRALPPNLWSRYNTSCSRVSAVTFVTGIGLLAVFAFLNAPFRAGE